MGIATQERANKFISALLSHKNQRGQYESDEIYTYESDSQTSGKSGIYIKNKEGLYDILSKKKFIESMGVVYAEDIYTINYNDGKTNYMSSKEGTNKDLYDSNKTQRRVITYTETKE